MLQGIDFFLGTSSEMVHMLFMYWTFTRYLVKGQSCKRNNKTLLDSKYKRISADVLIRRNNNFYTIVLTYRGKAMICTKLVLFIARYSQEQIRPRIVYKH